MPISRRVITATAAILLTVGVGAAPAVASHPGITEMSSSASSSMDKAINKAARNAYASLPREIRNNPQVLRQATAWGLVDKPQAPAAHPAHTPQGTQEKKGRGAAPRPGCPNCVALTYDDGPAGSTHRLLDILDKNHAKASFMVLGPHAARNPGLLKRMQASGMTMGNHSMTHRELNKLSYAEVSREMQETNAAIKAATGQSPRWMRPPYGSTNGTVAKAAGDNGMSLALWSVDTLDWKYRDPARTCRVAVGEAHPGSIILMHDIHPTTVDSAQCIIDGLRKKGLEPVSLDQLIPAPVPGKTYTNR